MKIGKGPRQNLILFRADTITMGELIERELGAGEGTPEWRAWVAKRARR